LLPIGGTLFFFTVRPTKPATPAGIQAEASGSSGSAEGKPVSASSLSDQPLAPYQTELLEIAFDAASKFPIHPHIVNRSIAQDAVVATCFDLDQPRRALGFVEKIADWRRGKGYADYAFYCARHGAADEAPNYLELAQKVAESWMKDDTFQQWHVDRIKASMSRAYLAMGETQQAARYETGTADSEAEKVEVFKASLLTDDAFDHELDLIDNAIRPGNFDMTKSALKTCTQLYKSFYENADRRSLLESKVRASWEKLPLQLRIELLMDLTEAALAHQDRSKALALVGESRTLLETAPWHPEDHITLLAKLAALRHRAGESQAAKDDAAEALARFDAERVKIENFNRAKILRPLAEAYQSMGDRETSLRLYKRAIEEGSVNQNARPRAQDLSATCCSMAVHAIEPDTGLHQRILQLRDGLGDPW
jgi:tetratricopeptide (TPR) repeat protein